MKSLDDKQQTKTFIISPTDIKLSDRDIGLLKEEAHGLCEALDLDVIDILTPVIKKVNPATYITKGHLENIKNIIEVEDIELLYVDIHIKPGQQRDLEEYLQIKVIDRTGIILEIFANRAKTQEGKIQVDLAYKMYQKSRLVRAWTHLERQRGGGGFVGGPGEKQTELDRRMLDVEIRKLEKDLEKIKSNRALQRRARERESFPIIALVGYTNAGKSTLFNLLTDASVLSKDMLFATLDPTMRVLELPNGQKAIMSDTVGFIRNLPTQLVSAFGATLEEVAKADIILHVHDANSPDFENQKQTVKKTLENLDIDYNSNHILQVYNKIDLLQQSDPFEAKRLKNIDVVNEKAVAISAHTGEGIDSLLNMLVTHLTSDQTDCTFEIPSTDGKAISWLHAHATVKNIEYIDDKVMVNIKIKTDQLNKFISIFDYQHLPL